MSSGSSPCHPEERSDEGSLGFNEYGSKSFAPLFEPKTEILRFAQDDRELGRRDGREVGRRDDREERRRDDRTKSEGMTEAVAWL
jgi:hypothetical protein